MARDQLGVRMMEMRIIGPRPEMIDWYIWRGYTKTDRTEPFPYAHLVKSPFGQTLALFFSGVRSPPLLPARI
jgi:hypothetical protein